MSLDYRGQNNRDSWSSFDDFHIRYNRLSWIIPHHFALLGAGHVLRCPGPSPITYTIVEVRGCADPLRSLRALVNLSLTPLHFGESRAARLGTMWLPTHSLPHGWHLLPYATALQ